MSTSRPRKDVGKPVERVRDVNERLVHVHRRSGAFLDSPDACFRIADVVATVGANAECGDSSTPADRVSISTARWT